MEDERIAIVDLADEFQIRKQRLFKICKRLTIATESRREPGRGNQLVATVTAGDAELLREELAKPTASDGGVPGSEGGGFGLADDVGVFYLIQLEPQHDPGRFKVGFSMDPEVRIRKHRCAAPFAEYVKTWPCRRKWEQTAIDCVTAECDQLHTEVFRAASLDSVVRKGNAFFSTMPSVSFEDRGASDEERCTVTQGDDL